MINNEDHIVLTYSAPTFKKYSYKQYKILLLIAEKKFVIYDDDYIHPYDQNLIDFLNKHIDKSDGRII